VIDVLRITGKNSHEKAVLPPHKLIVCHTLPPMESPARNGAGLRAKVSLRLTCP
jgi:hypothetical protein